MSHDAHEKLVYMANQIAKFMESKPPAEGVVGLSSHINDFWEPRMRRHLFEVIDAGGQGLRPLVLEAAAKIKRPTQTV
jgi:formate dehydrogenase subunit delta